MTIEEIKKGLVAPEYDFLRKNEHLGENIILLGLGGSYAYGTNSETSDVDIRGISTLRPIELLTNSKYEQFDTSSTDTVIYGLNKAITLLSSCNPNVIEILGLEPEHYFYISEDGKKLLDNKDIFLSRLAIPRFGGYVSEQFQRMMKLSIRDQDQVERLEHILHTLNCATELFGDTFNNTDNRLKMYIDKSDRDEYDSEIFMDLTLKHYPIKDYENVIGKLKNIERSYDSIGKRNKHALNHDKMGKHMMTLVRVYLMAFDLLEKKEIKTFRKDDIDFLLEIKKGKYLTEDNKIRPEFEDLVNELEKRLKYASKNTDLPEKPDYDAINQLMIDINTRVITMEMK
jgi:hypothetical protein